MPNEFHLVNYCKLKVKLTFLFLISTQEQLDPSIPKVRRVVELLEPSKG